MVTTIIAIYGAVVATVSTVLGAWYFLRSGPILQADASIEQLTGEWNDDSRILLRVWNNGRAEITVQITYFIINHGHNHLGFPLEGSEFRGRKGLRIQIYGPEVPIRISGHSGESWIIKGGFDIRSITPFTSGKLSFLLEVGGNRAVKVPVMDRDGMIKRRFVLRPVQELEPPPEVPTTRVVRQQPVQQARRKRSGRK